MRLALASLCLLAWLAPASAQERIHNLKVLSDKVDDVTSVDSILKSFTKPGMADADRAKGVWTAVVKYRHQTSPPNEHLSADWEAHDPVKIMNVYGYCMCCCCSALIEGLNRADGRDGRGRILNGHSVPEVFYGGGWHMYDSSLITYFPKGKDGPVASVDEIAAAVKGWYAKNPGYQKNDAKLNQLMRQDGWTGWKQGPELLTQCPFYNQGWFPARTHGWNATMAEYDRASEVYHYGYQLGHKALLSLRPGESFVREAGHRGLHVNGDRGWDVLKQKVPEGDLVYLKDFFPGYTGGVVGNGVHRYQPDPATLKSAAIIPMTSPYVYLGGRVKLKAVKKAPADQMTLSLSTNNGRSFTPIWSADKSGEATVELGERVLRRYAYLLKVELAGSGGIESLAIENDIQHAPRTLPWLGQGGNTITVAADGDTSIATRTINGRITPDSKFDKNESTASLGVVFDNLDVKDGGCWWKGGVGRMTVPIDVPGDLVALRFGAQARARGDKDAIQMLLSFDAGKTWEPAAKIAGPTPGRTEYFQFTEVPAGARQALLRYELSGNNTIGIFSFRVDVDYRDPQAAKAHRPFDVVHRWKENGQEKTHRETVPKLPHTYPIKTAAAPEMVSVTVEMAAAR